MRGSGGPDVDKAAGSTNSLKLSKLFAEKINKYGGKAQVLMLLGAAARLIGVTIVDYMRGLGTHSLGARRSRARPAVGR